MEKEEQKLEQAEMEEQDVEEAAPLVRKSRNGDEGKSFGIPDIDGDGEGSNGFSTSNGQNGAQNKAMNGEHKEMENIDWVLENKQESINGDHKIEETDGVLENGSEAINGEKNSVNLVFHDKFEGVNPIPTIIWKTQIWDGPAHSKSDDSDLNNGTSVLNNQYEEESEENSVSSSNNESSDTSSQEGVKSTLAHIVTDTILKGPAKLDDSSLDFATQFNGTSAVNNQYEEEIEENGLSSLNVQPSSQEGGTSYEPSKEIESAETDLVNEDDLEITESDVERVIKNQTTHDLYCPNCKSCITKRVILSKRKRRLRIPAEAIKRPKPESVLLEDQVHEEGEVDNVDAQVLLTDEDERDRGPHIFRCLSCFSIFIPTGDGFKLFRLFGDKSGKENVKDEQAPPNVKKNWFSNMFKPNKQETVFEQASYSAIPSSDPAQQSGEPSVLRDTGIYEGEDKTLTSPNLVPSENGILRNGGRGKLDIKATDSADATRFDVLNTDQRMEFKSGPGELQTNQERVFMENAEDGISFPEKDGLKSQNNSNKKIPYLQNSEEDLKANQIVQPGGADKNDVHLPPPPVSMVEASDVDGTLSISVSIPHEEQAVTATIVTTSLLDKSTDSRSSDNGEIYPAEVPQQLVTTQTFDFHHDEPLRTGISSAVVDAPAGQGNDTRITIETHPPETQVNTVDGERSGARQERKIEVIKSIVYGGLAESMTSLSVVASAAGGGAATLNVLAMGAANLIGGLFIICHNLWDLKCDRVEEQMSNQVTEQADRYRQLLGQRQNFALHAVVSIISYLIFGSVSPVVYGFSFRETDDKQLKLVVVAAASLFCILMLAVAKAYVQRPPKPYLKTVMTFLTLGIMISGVSYAAGGLVERLLERFGVFEASSTAAPNLMRPVGSEWASY